MTNESVLRFKILDTFAESLRSSIYLILAQYDYVTSFHTHTLSDESPTSVYIRLQVRSYFFVSINHSPFNRNLEFNLD